MKKIFIAGILLFACIGAARSQTASDSVRTTVINLFSAMKNADSILLKACFADSAILQTIYHDKSGLVKVRDEKVAEFISFVGNEQKGNADERITIHSINIDGDLAILWTPYSFYYKGKFSHCGVNSFHLVRFNTGWKIQYLIDTRRKNGCIGN
jgi:hypothetical protein